METFNKHTFLTLLKAEIADPANDITDVSDFIHQEIDNAVIYYSSCYAIIADCGITEWSEHDTFGTPTNISQLAYIALFDFVNDNIWE